MLLLLAEIPLVAGDTEIPTWAIQVLVAACVGLGMELFRRTIVRAAAAERELAAKDVSDIKAGLKGVRKDLDALRTEVVRHKEEDTKFHADMHARVKYQLKPQQPPPGNDSDPG